MASAPIPGKRTQLDPTRFGGGFTGVTNWDMPELQPPGQDEKRTDQEEVGGLGSVALWSTGADDVGDLLTRPNVTVSQSGLGGSNDWQQWVTIIASVLLILWILREFTKK